MTNPQPSDDETFNAVWFERARACLTAIAENVSAEMVEAGAEQSSFNGIDPAAVRAEVVACFLVMIRAAVGG